jgi:hypothetical protein
MCLDANVYEELVKDPSVNLRCLKTSNAFGLYVYFIANRTLLRLELIEVWMLQCVEHYITLHCHKS